MPRFRITIKGKNEKSGNDITTNFEISRCSLQEAREDAKSEAQKRHPNYNITITKIEQL